MVTPPIQEHLMSTQKSAPLAAKKECKLARLVSQEIDAVLAINKKIKKAWILS